MYFYLIKLARFISKNEQITLAEDLKQLLTPHVTFLEISHDKWGAKNRLIMEIEPITIKITDLNQKLRENPGISSIILFTPQLFNWEFSSFPALINQLADFLNTHNAKKSYVLDFRAIGRLPFHRKAIIDRLKRKKLLSQGESEFHLYLEIKPRKKKNLETDPTFQARIGTKFVNEFLVNGTPQTFDPKLVLFSPFTTQEVADFFRLGLAFNISIILTNENGKAQDLINRVQKTFFKGVTKVSFKIVPSLENLIIQNPALSYGFSLWGTKSVSEFPSMIQSLHCQESKTPITYFIFGNEENGLPLFIRYKIPIFRIGRQASEPLRASQAAAYILGTLYSL